MRGPTCIFWANLTPFSHQAVHVGNLAEESHPEYARDQAPSAYIERFQHIGDEQRRNLSAMVVRTRDRTEPESHRVDPESGSTLRLL